MKTPTNKSRMNKSTAGLYGGRYFESAEAAALQFQYAARLRAANSRDKRFSPLMRASMQRDAAAFYAIARAAIAKATQGELQ